MPSWTVTELAPLGRLHRLRLAGEIDATAASGLAQALGDAGRPGEHLLIDVTGVVRLGATGLRALAREEHHRAVSGGSLVLAGPREDVRRELARAGLLHLAQPPEPQRASA